MHCFRSVSRLLLAASGLLAALQAQAQSVFITPAGQGSGNTGFTINASTFTSAGTFLASSAANQVLTNPAGTKLYVISRSGSDTVIILDAANPSSTSRRLSLGQNATAAVFAPDGRRLLVLTNTLNVIDAVTDAQVNAGTTLDVGANPIDLAVSVDGTRAFVLSGDSSRLTAVDLSSLAVVGSFTIPSRPTGVTVAPNGLVYVSAQGALHEIDGRTLTLRGTVSLTGQPGKLQVTPDGTKGVAVNQTPATGATLLFVFDLVNRAVAASAPTFSDRSETLDKLVVVSNSRAFAGSNTGALYDLTLSPLSLTAATFSGLFTVQNALSIASSNERPQSRYLFIGSGNSVYRVDLGTTPNTASAALPLSGPAGAISYFAAPGTGQPASITTYNANQVAPLGGTFLPLVLQALDANGRPMINVPVTFTSSTTAATVASFSSVTNALGFAVANVTAPSTAQQFTVSATVGTLANAAVFSLNLGGSGGGTGGGGTGTQGGVIITGGNGQLIFEQSISKDLEVTIRDTANAPVAGTTVTFTLNDPNFGYFLSSGNATTTCTFSGSATSGGLNIATCPTDTNGVARVALFGSSVLIPTLLPTTTVTAAALGGTATFTETLVSRSSAGAAPSAFLVSPEQGTTLTLQAGQTSTNIIQVNVGSKSGPVPGIGVTILSPVQGQAPLAQCEGGVALTDATGVARCRVVGGTTLGTGPIIVDIGGGFSQFITLNASVAPGPAAKVNLVQGDQQTGNPGQVLPQALVAQITDQFNNPIQGLTVQFTVVTAGTASLTAPTNTTTDAQGRVSTRVTLGSTPGAAQIRVTAGAATGTFTVNTNIAYGGITVVSGGSQIAALNQPFAQPLVVQVVNTNNQAVPNATVTFAVTAGTASFSGGGTTATAQTNAQGQASVSLVAGATAGSVTVTASVAGLQAPASFTLTVIPPGPVITANSFVNAASFQPGITPGGLATIIGTGLAPGVQGVLLANPVGIGPLASTLNNTQITFNGLTAPIYSIVNLNGQEQITVQVPYELQAGTATAVVNVGNGSSTTVQNVPVRSLQPGLFETTGPNGARYGVLQRPDGSFVSPSNPARRGEQLRMFATGLGQTSPATGTNRAGIPGQTAANSVIVGVNNAGVGGVSAELLAGSVGIFVVTFTVPSDTAAGASQPLALAVVDPATNQLVFAGGSSLPIQ